MGEWVGWPIGPPDGPTCLNYPRANCANLMWGEGGRLYVWRGGGVVCAEDTTVERVLTMCSRFVWYDRLPRKRMYRSLLRFRLAQVRSGAGSSPSAAPPAPVALVCPPHIVVAGTTGSGAGAGVLAAFFFSSFSALSAATARPAAHRRRTPVG